MGYSHDDGESVYARCKSCLMFGTPMPEELESDETRCGNCGSLNVVQYLPPCCVNVLVDRARQDTARSTAAGRSDG